MGQIVHQTECVGVEYSLIDSEGLGTHLNRVDGVGNHRIMYLFDTKSLDFDKVFNLHVKNLKSDFLNGESL